MAGQSELSYVDYYQAEFVNRVNRGLAGLN